ncbi:MAG: polysaccharide biosynthesis C-terminal domain-containing protein [Lachnospiraceae bacterium]|nr:polysaccharide biosynthesis C-terminal domain-containing protein [Lachnospiraceae bacterium]
MTDDRAKTRKIIKGTGIYAVGTFGTKILSFLIVPLYTYYIATGEMGIYDIFMTLVSLLTPLITMQISDAAYKYLINEETENKESYIRACVQVLFFNCVIASLIVIAVGSFVNIKYLYYFAAVLIISRSYQTLYKILRGLGNQWLFVASGLTYTVVLLTLNIIRICVFKTGIDGLFRSQIDAGLVTLIMIFVFEKRLRISYLGKPDIPLIKKMLGFSIPLVPNYLNWWVIDSSDKLIVYLVLGPAANGILFVANKFPTMLSAVLQLFTNSWTDVSVADGEKSEGEYYGKVFKNYCRFVFMLLLFLIPVTKVFIHLVMGPDYKQACDYVSFYYLGAVFQSFSSFYSVGYMKSGKTIGAFVTSLVGAAVNVVVDIALIYLVGLHAAAISTFIGFFVMWILRERQNRDKLNIRVDKKIIAVCTLASIGMCILSIFTNMYINGALAAVFAVLFLVTNIDMIKKIIKRS